MVSDDRPVGAAIVGTGWGLLTHAPAMRDAGIDVRWLVGRDRERTDERAAAAGVHRATVDLDEVLDDPAVDLVVVATPPDTHAPLVVRAAEAGRHVMCEKPFAHSLDDAKRMRDAVRAAGVLGVVGHEFRFLGDRIATREAVGSGLIGAPKLFTHTRLSSTLAGVGATVPGWFGERAAFGGWLNAEVQHLIDEIRGLLGELASVTVLEQQVTERNWDVGDTFAAQFVTCAGAVGTILSSVGTAGSGLSVQRISGTNGCIWTDPDGSIVVDDGSGRRVLAAAAPRAAATTDPTITDLVSTNTLSRALSGASGMLREPTRVMYEAVRQRILSGGDDPAAAGPATFDDGVANTAVHMAMLRSMRSGGTERIEPV